jgi:hypothetical protein
MQALRHDSGPFLGLNLAVASCKGRWFLPLGYKIVNAQRVNIYNKILFWRKPQIVKYYKYYVQKIRTSHQVRILGIL